MKKKNPYQFGNTDEDIVDGSLYEYESENYVPVDTETPDAGPDTGFIAERIIESSLTVGSVASEGVSNNAQATYQARTNEPKAQVRDEDLKSLVEHIPSGNKLDVQSLHEDMVLAERELSKSEGYIASAGQSRSAYQQYLKNEFQGLNSKDFDALPKPNEVEFGSQSQAREYTDYYDLRGYNHHKTISYYTNAEDQQMRLQEASAHINNFEDRLKSDSRYASIAKHIDRQCQNMGITEDQRQEMEAQAEKDFIQSGAIDNSKGVISAWEMNQRGVSKDQADLHKLRCQREEMVRDGQANSDEYKELMSQIEEQRKEVFLDPVQTQEEALEQLKEQDQQEQIQQVHNQEVRPEENRAQEVQYEELEDVQSQGDLDLTQEQPEESLGQEEQVDLDDHLQRQKRTVEDEATEERDVDTEIENPVSRMDSSSQESAREEAQQPEWDRHSEESIFVEAQQEEMDEEALEAQRIVRQQELASMRSSSDSAAMGGEQIDDSYLIEQEPVEYDLDEDEEFDIDDSLEIEETPELIADNSEEIAQQVEADKDFERELAELAGEHFGDQAEENQEQELDSGLESEFEMESEPVSDATEDDNEIEEEAHPFNQELEDAFQAAMESEDMLEFEKNGGLTAEQEMELDALLDDLGGQQEERELGIDMDDENERDNEFSR